MRLNTWLGCLLTVVSLSACGDDMATVSTSKRDGDKNNAGKGGSAGTGAHRDSGVPDDPDGAAVAPKPGAVNPAAPVIEILEPAALANPNAGDVLTSTTVTVHCRATMSKVAGARDVNQSTAQISLLTSDPTKPIKGTVVTAGNGEFTADFDLSDHPNGSLQFECAASDVGKPALTGRATVDTFLDLGPTIELLEPADGSAYKLTQPVPVRFRITSSPVSPDDEQAAVTGIHLVVSGQEYDFTEDPAEKGLYTKNIDFNDRSIFLMPPTTAEIVVSASSSRTPTAAERSAKSDITIDSEGPIIVIKTPKSEALVRGDVLFQLVITDASGVDPSSVSARIELGPNSYTLTEWMISGNTYSDHFDTHGFDQKLSQMTINVRATDNVGNESTPEPILLRLDNVPPIISLDPPLIREYKVVANMNRCSEPFDPVGADAASDLSTVRVQSLYRAMMWDRTNYAPGQNVLYVAGISDVTAQLYTQPDPAIPLLIDTNGDHICDEINNKGADAENPAVALDLAKIKRAGSAEYSTTPNFADPNHTPRTEDACVAATGATMPNDLCPSSKMVRAISQPLDTSDPPGAIFAPGATSASTGACDGITWDLYHVTGREGWTCVAARVQDTIDNIGISAPLRVCIDNEDPNDGIPNCDPEIGKLITCAADNCAWPDQFPSNMTVLAR